MLGVGVYGDGSLWWFFFICCDSFFSLKSKILLPSNETIERKDLQFWIEEEGNGLGKCNRISRQP